MWCFRK